VTADGQLLHTDAETHPELFWAIRGGGGNFGVATRLQFRLHPVDQILGGMLLLPAAPEVIAAFVAGAEAAPEELSTIANIMKAPPTPMVPEEAHGRPVVMALLCWAGDLDAGDPPTAGRRIMAPSARSGSDPRRRRPTRPGSPGWRRRYGRATRGVRQLRRRGRAVHGAARGVRGGARRGPPAVANLHR
jgi:hypothetical protein